MAGIRNDGMVANLAADFRKLYSPAHAWADAVSMAQMMPGLVGLWPGSIGGEQDVWAGLLFADRTNGRVGIGTSAPTVTLDLLGSIAFRTTSMTLADGDNNNVVLPAGATFVQYSGPTAAHAITGIAGGTDGRLVLIMGTVGQPLTIKNNSGSSSAGNRIVTQTSADITPGNRGTVILIYDGVTSAWRVVSARGASGAV